ncbi:exodeoxyribonuclease VII small subunit [Spirulina sp. CCNP1310]|uniref:exodeoxyribonuclease VII small subunit n=1 Tax=Spirulina sp. CCNP1310 TaxID=3110249 RepID=UPI002B1FE90D|nr:exodeoxyribonuclease VII small subunit [Spirulina sp. CCNP1310]MEA5417899.1 exodeoxyribonuclease VII small subunit [Spirulina sp. CCNP1310]
MAEWNYETAIAQVEAIIQQLETGNLPLEQVFSQFEVATTQLRDCETFLAAGQQQINLVVETLGSESELDG